MTFEQLCATYKLTPEERRQAAIYLLVLRLTQMWDELLWGVASRPCTVRDHKDHEQTIK